jgi:hypothetical protein
MGWVPTVRKRELVSIGEDQSGPPVLSGDIQGAGQEELTELDFDGIQMR